MANSDKNILITPNIGSATANPTIRFTGSDNIPITLRVLDSATIAFEGSVGQLFSISNSLTGTIFSVNDVSGIPSIEVLDTGTVRLAQYSGNVGIGASTPKTRLQVSAASQSSAMPSLGTASGSLYVTNSDTAYGLLAGVSSSTGAVWLQAQRTDVTATAYNILLNPSGGNVGIGTSTLTAKLTTNGSVQFGASLTATNNWHLTTEAGDGTLRFWNGNYGSGTERMRIGDSGNIGIGTTTMTGKLNVTGAASGISGYFSDAVNSSLVIANLPGGVTLGTDGGGGIHLATNGAAAGNRRLSIDSAGNVSIPGALTVSGTLTASVANATSSSNTLALRQTDGTSLLTPVTSVTTSGGRAANLAPNTYRYGLFSEFKNTGFGVATVGANYGGLLTYAVWDSTVGSTGDPSYQMFFSPVGANSTSVPFMQIRAGIDTTWGNWGLVQTVTVNTTAKTAAYQLTTADASNIIQMNGAFAFNINNTLSVLPAGTTITLVALTTGVSVAANGTATVPTILSTPGLKLRAANSVATLIKMSVASASGSASTWLLTGDLIA